MQQAQDRILRMPAVLNRTGLSRSTLYRLISKETFPKQLRLSTLCSGWRESEINHWIANRYS